MKIDVSVDGVTFGTSISDIKVPEQLEYSIETGIDFFDNAFGGTGQTPSGVTLLTGTPGAGKTTMLLGVASALAMRGHLVVFNTGEESAFQIKKVYNRLNLPGNFKMGQMTHVPTLLKACSKMAKEFGVNNKERQLILINDSLQTLDDGHFSTGRISSATAERALAQITAWCKQNWYNAIVIGQVTKSGEMAGRNKLKHMVDTFIELNVIKREDDDYFGCRRMFTEKNRFGGAGMVSYLRLSIDGFLLVAQLNIDEF